ncbi:MAG: DMT family transporter [Proteobacteria bacterium]|nr:DMT family transporter [Pseudomonadota bacterium]
MLDGNKVSIVGRGTVQEQKRTQAGILFLLGAIGFITVVDTAAKYMTAALPPLELVWGYFLGIFVCLVGLGASKGGRLPRLLTTRRPLLHFGRSGLLVLSISLLFVALKYMSLADATAISFTSPLFITLLAIPILGERVDRARWLAVFAGLCGVLVVVRPGSGLATWISLLPLLGALSFAGFQISTRLLANTETTFAILFYTGAGGLAWSSLALPFVWSMPEPVYWLVFLIQGALGVGAHLCMIKAFELAEASLLAPFNYSKIIWAAAAGYLVFGDRPSLNTIAGAMIIALAGLFMMLHERRNNRTAGRGPRP